ncbi:MAG: Ig-like domain-containing protein, partial [Oscillospiraceae bacterium]|nr:Ig-like domain-containing protein [Oscillospiraceae bacterium]
MRTPITRRILSVVLLASMLVSMLGSSFAFAAEVTTDEPEAATEVSASEEALVEDISAQAEAPESVETPEEVEPVPEAAEVLTDEEPATEETEDTEAVEEPVSYTYDGYEAPNLFADEVPDYFLDPSNWNVLDNSEPVLPVSDLSAEEQMAQANQELVSSSVMATSDGYDYEEELAKFPASYQPYLEALHELHPEWVFVAVDTGLTWEEVIEGELGDASTIDYNLNTTTHHLLLNNHDGYYSTSGYSSTNGYKPIDGRHVSCSRAAIAYYMDPRNFLTEKYIFQFEDQSYSSVQQLAGVQKILKNADSTATGLYNMKNYVTTSGSTATLASLGSDYGSDYSTIIYRSGMAAGVSPYYLASKIAQETGATTTNASISGTYSGYTGIYNFYNIGAYASTTGEAVTNGLKYAKEHGWTNPILAVKGGADFLASSYIAKGQNTGYYMRFNVGPDAYYSTFSHQYMSATYAVAAEATSTYSGYKDAGAVDSAFLFYIPVYDNMPDQDSSVSLTATTKGTTNASTQLYDIPSTHYSTLLTTIPSGAAVTVLGGSVTSDTTYISRLYYPYWYKVTVTVSGTSYTGYVREEKVDLSANYNLKAGAQQTLANICSTSGNVGTIYYETSDPNVATVSDSGIITAKANGTCKIYAISTGGSFDAIGVTVSSSGSSGNTVATLDPPAPVSAANTAAGIKVTWSKVSDATGYIVYRKTSSSTGWSRITTISSGSTVSYTD